MVRDMWRSNGSERRCVTRHFIVLPRCPGVCGGVLVHCVLVHGLRQCEVPRAGGIIGAFPVRSGRASVPRATVRPNRTRAALWAVQQPRRDHVCHTPIVRRWFSASPQNWSYDRVAPASPKHPVAIWASCAAREQGWKGRPVPSSRLRRLDPSGMGGGRGGGSAVVGARIKMANAARTLADGTAVGRRLLRGPLRAQPECISLAKNAVMMAPRAWRHGHVGMQFAFFQNCHRRCDYRSRSYD